MARKETKAEFRARFNGESLNQGGFGKACLADLADYYVWHLRVHGYADMDHNQVTIVKLLMTMGYKFDLSTPHGVESK